MAEDITFLKRRRLLFSLPAILFILFRHSGTQSDIGSDIVFSGI